MNIRYITCSDPREDVPIGKLIELLSLSPLVEIGIQAHPSTMSALMPRNAWFEELLYISANMDKPLNIAIHVNYQWCSAFCNGDVAPELADWMSRQNNVTKTPLINRWQLNIGDKTEAFDENVLAKLLGDYPDREFIFPHNASVKKQIAKLNATGAKFSLLFDSSYGYGVTPDSWRAPVYPNRPQGYAGGFGDDNVCQSLDKISKLVPDDYAIWIDAEGKLMKPGTRQFDTQRARDYVNNALGWLTRHRAH